MRYIIIFQCLKMGNPGRRIKKFSLTKTFFSVCTDPRTMKKYEPYVEWADEYSCTRHRCQPGGRNLAIYTVGCKRVEAPESAIECEEVVEDTNMQFPFCCTRLRCLVVVRGEVWTRVLGQPWEHLPAAPWSHMYKMKKPPPGDTFLPKTPEQGPVYELMDPEANNPRDKVLRAGKTTTTENPDCNDVVPRSAPAPDIVIALSTNSDQKEHKKGERKRHKRIHKSSASQNSMPEEGHDQELQEMEDAAFTEKPPEPASEERFNVNAYGVTQRIQFKNQHHQVSWTEIPQNQWSEHETPPEADANKENNFPQEFPPQEPEKKEEKPNNLQALVDAIGTRMRDIENVVQRMSEKVHRDKVPEPEYGSLEKRPEMEPHKHHKDNNDVEYGKMKKPNPEGDHYKRFSVRNRGSKYLHGMADATTEQPLFIEDNNMNGYFSDASNNVLRRANHPKEPAATYMAPVDTRRKAPSHIVLSDSSGDQKKRKKHLHKKKRGKGHGHKKHHGKEEKRKRFTKLSSAESDKNAVSLEDSSAVTNK
ncbi:hypothetical protein O3G_MSEX007229 [Manduca sexta]|uniref:Uncharacterized protein n=2 Tax=Manduca sexta TaxID=7130 RepID=A0A922CN68_MANSE|nr:hypothetical protein O3G_MSEX007229 [Manduca sexta]